MTALQSACAGCMQVLQKCRNSCTPRRCLDAAGWCPGQHIPALATACRQTLGLWHRCIAVAAHDYVQRKGTAWCSRSWFHAAELSRAQPSCTGCKQCGSLHSCRVAGGWCQRLGLLQESLMQQAVVLRTPRGTNTRPIRCIHSCALMLLCNTSVRPPVRHGTASARSKAFRWL